MALVLVGLVAEANAHEAKHTREIHVERQGTTLTLAITQVVGAGRDAATWRHDADRDGNGRLDVAEAEALGERLRRWAALGVVVRCGEREVPATATTLVTLHGGKKAATSGRELHGIVELTYELPEGCAPVLRDAHPDPRSKTRLRSGTEAPLVVLERGVDRPL